MRIYKLLLLLVALLLLNNCSRSRAWNKELPPTSELYSAQRGLILARTQIHLHTPYSWDACDIDKNVCFENLRAALCMNRVDAAFLTDHPNNMAYQEFSNLLLHSEQDTGVLKDSEIIANQITCPNSHQAILSAGFENQLMTVGMSHHIDPDPNIRLELYQKATPEIVQRLQTETDALVIIPHTESRELDLLKSLGMNGIEVYNIHANVSPIIRHDFLGFDYFKGLIDIITYWIDPYSSQETDLAFLPFLQVSPVYSQKWASLIAANKSILGVGGTDAHQNLLPGKANDGDKIDSYRRMTRWLNNYLFVKEKNIIELKSALKNGRNWIVFEGLGSPVQFDYYAHSETSIAELGDTLSLNSKKVTLHASLPFLHKMTPQSQEKPSISIKLIRVNQDGSQTEVLNTQNSPLDYEASEPGAYRIEVGITPKHFSSFISYKNELLNQEYPWIITNHIFLKP